MRRKEREVTDRNEIEEILRQCKTCHVAMIDGEQPYVIPLSYGYRFLEDNTLELYFHAAREGRKMDVWAKNNLVCFVVSLEGEPIHAETPCNSGYYFSSVMGYGEVIILQDTGEKCNALAVMFKHQSSIDVVFNESHLEKVCVFKIRSTDYTGKKKPLLT